MKKMLFLTVLFCGVSSALLAQESPICWGTEGTYKKKHTYCFSTQTMNWWSAFAWCDAQGRHLASISELCDYDNYVYGLNATRCSNKSWGLYGWTSNVTSDESKAYSVVDGAVTATSKTSNQKAVCY